MGRRFNKYKQRKGNYVATQMSCTKKIKYDDVDEAWEAVEYYFITKETTLMPYKCGSHYHLTTSKVGDIMNYPDYMRNLLSTHSQKLSKGFNLWKV